VIDHNHGYCAYIHTASGVITIRLLADAAPTSVNNFVYLAEHGFYDGLTIDRTCPNPQDSSCPAGAQFVESSTRSGTTAQYVLPHERVQGDYLLGSVLMDGNTTSDDPVRFLIATRDDRSLPKIYNLFGQVTGGIVEAAHLKKGDVIDWIDVRATTA
jgi:cyclophilin family peptidyl-prolyl cis-trans isomerase